MGAMRVDPVVAAAKRKWDGYKGMVDRRPRGLPYKCPYCKEETGRWRAIEWIWGKNAEHELDPDFPTIGCPEWPCLKHIDKASR